MKSKGAFPIRNRREALYNTFDRIVLTRFRYYGLDVLSNIFCVACAFEVAVILRFVDTRQVWSQIVALFVPSVLVGCLYAVVAYALGLHRRLWSYAGLRDGLALLLSIVIMIALTGVLDIVNLTGVRIIPLGVLAGCAFLSFLFLGCAKMLSRVLSIGRGMRSKEGAIRVLIVGAGQAGATLSSRLLLNRIYGYQVMAFVDDDPTKQRRRLHGKSIEGPVNDIPDVVRKFAIDLIIIAIPSLKAERMGEIVALCQRTPARIKIMQGLNEMVGRQTDSPLLREVNVADLLGREVVPLQTTEAYEVFADRVVLVTGAAGSIGSELCRQLLAYKPKVLLAVDNNETGLFELAEDCQTYLNTASLVLCVNDITDGESMEQLFKQYHPQILFHAAAYKHVPLLERHIRQAVRTNILSTWSLCQLAQQQQVERFVFISSDKAAEPVSVLGASKQVGELIVQSLASQQTTTKFCGVRFGNVIGSRGSVVPTFLKQIERGGPVTVTHPETTRYFMTIPEACGLVIHTATIATNGGLFLLDMGEPVRIAELAAKMIRLRGLRVTHDIPIVYTGLRPGERLHEILAAHNEKLLATIHDKIFQLVPEEGGTPSSEMISQYMNFFQNALLQDDTAMLREQLFMIVREPISV